MGLWVESGCLAKEKGISGRETKYARMWTGESVLLLENYDLLRLEVSPRQEGVGDKAGRGMHTRSCPHSKAFGQSS